MIPVTRLNGTQFHLNTDLIQSVEATPDTIITLVNGVKLIVREPVAVIVARVMEYQQALRHPWTVAESGA
jgi:flagellar protein FlbD